MVGGSCSRFWQSREVGPTWCRVSRVEVAQLGLAQEVGTKLYAEPLGGNAGVESSGKPKGYGCASKNRYQNGTLVSGNMDQHLRNPSWSILNGFGFLNHLGIRGLLPSVSTPFPISRVECFRRIGWMARFLLQASCSKPLLSAAR